MYVYTHIRAETLTYIINERLPVLLKDKDLFPFGNRGRRNDYIKLFLLLTTIISSGLNINKINSLRDRKAKKTK